MKFVKTVQLKTLEEVLKIKGVSKVETGIVLFEGATLKEWLNPEELHMLGKEVDVYVDKYDVMYDLILKNGNVITMNNHNERKKWIAVNNRKIAESAFFPLCS